MKSCKTIWNGETQDSWAMQTQFHDIITACFSYLYVIYIIMNMMSMFYFQNGINVQVRDWRVQLQ